MHLRDLGIAVRLALGLALILAIAGIATAAVLFKTYQTERDLASFATGYEKTVLLKKIGDVFHDNMYSVSALFNSDDPDAMSTFTAQIEANRKVNGDGQSLEGDHQLTRGANSVRSVPEPTRSVSEYSR